MKKTCHPISHLYYITYDTSFCSALHIVLITQATKSNISTITHHSMNPTPFHQIFPSNICSIPNQISVFQPNHNCVRYTHFKTVKHRVRFRFKHSRTIIVYILLTDNLTCSFVYLFICHSCSHSLSFAVNNFFIIISDSALFSCRPNRNNAVPV